MGLISILSKPSTVSAQEIEKDILPQQLVNYSSNHLEEKIFLHTDKSTYLANEICWFKVYNVDAFFHLPIAISTIAYIEILDNNSKAIVQEKVALKNGFGSGSIALPGNINSGYYTLRAYTNWMKNYSTDFFFQKTIAVFNTKKTLEILSNNPNEAFKIQVFPEGGNIVNDLSNKIAFKLSDPFGNGIQSKGFILNEYGETVASVKSFKFGIGNFSFKPITGHQYSIRLDLPSGKQISQSLPTAFNQGYVMQLIDPEKQNDTLKVQIASKQVNGSTVYLLIHSRGVVKTFLKTTLIHGLAEYSVPISKLGDGINTITIFDEKRNPVCERLYFKFPTNNLNFAAKLDSHDYSTRNKVNLQIETALERGIKTSANLSMSVYRVDSLQNVDESTIQNYIWLTSDLTGKVESPNNYFNINDDGRFEAMDNLMLTNGWRRFQWENILSNTNPSFQYLPEIDGKIITGKVVSLKDNFTPNGVNAYLSMASRRTQFRSSKSDKNGLIKFQFPDFYNDDQVIAQIEKDNAFNYKIEIENPFIKSIITDIKRPIVYSPDYKFEMSHYNRDLQVQNYFNLNYSNSFINQVIDTSTFYYKADNTYLLDDYSRFTTLEEVFREFIVPVKLTKLNGNFDISVYDNVQKRYFNNQPLILLDGYPIADLNKFMEYDPLKIRKIEIVERMYFLGNTNYNGIVNLTTYNGKMEGYELDPQAVVLDFKGLQSQREFSAPSYENKTQLSNRQPDFRHLLYWDDTIITSANTKKDISFYCSDIPGKYVIVLQGIDNEGHTGYKEISFDVKDH